MDEQQRNDLSTNLSLDEWKIQMQEIGGLAFAGFLEGSYREVCQGHFSPVGYLMRALDNLRDVTATFALSGPHYDPDEGDVFYGCVFRRC